MATIVARDRLQCLVTPFEAVRTLCDMDSTFDARFHRGLAIALAGLSPCGVVFCSVLQCVAVCCSMFDVRLHRGLAIALASLSRSVAVCCSVLQCVVVCCSVLQCIAVCCALLCVAVLWSYNLCVAVLWSYTRPHGSLSVCCSVL